MLYVHHMYFYPTVLSLHLPFDNIFNKLRTISEMLKQASVTNLNNSILKLNSNHKLVQPTVYTSQNSQESVNELVGDQHTHVFET